VPDSSLLDRAVQVRTFSAVAVTFVLDSTAALFIAFLLDSLSTTALSVIATLRIPDRRTMANNGNGNGDAPVAAPKINTDIVTLTRFLTEEQAKHKEATGDFTYVPLSGVAGWRS
jgi:hypothetical protein